MTTNGATGGSWPIPDIILMSDYPGPSQATTVSNVTINQCNEFLRVHMDVPYGANDDIRKKIQTGDLAAAYKLILAHNDDGNKYPRATAVLAAALGLLDNVTPPGSTPAPGTPA
jgi:hypothetical protein